MITETPSNDQDFQQRRLTELVSRVFSIEDLTWGDGQAQSYTVRYRGRLLIDSAQAYDQLAEYLRPLGITPLFRVESGRQVIVLMPFVIQPRPSNPWVNLVMFVLTLLSVIFAGTLYAYDGPPAGSFAELMASLLARLGDGIPFAIALLSILLAHEFGHYLAGRYHKTHVTLPYFIPFPFSPFGTMGAFIQLKEPPRNRRILLDIGLAGPLAGLVVAIPVLLIGFSLSTVDRLPLVLRPGEALSLEGNSLLYLFMKFLAFGDLLPAPVSYGALPAPLYWLRYFFTGQPLPLGGSDVLLHPVAWAGWAGLLVTALNLIPAGQLDGGHVLYVLLGRRAQLVLPVILVSLVFLGTVWSGWWLWAFLIFFLGRTYAEPLDQITPLDPPRRAVAIFGLLLFVLLFMPVPLVTLMG
jgi:membrane-associated protease RseP (regulator of RpoE activity)